MSNQERTVIFQLPTVVSGSIACLEGTVVGRTWRLSAGTFVIGRSAECDLHLPTEPGVSKVHAKILAEGDHYVLEDNESRNGTIVNGHVVRRVMLADGDELQICGCRLRFTQTGGEGRRGEVVPQGAPPSQPPTAAPPSAAPASQAATAPPTDLVARVVDPDQATAPQKSGGGLAMPFLLGMLLVLVVGGGASAALLMLDSADSLEATEIPAKDVVATNETPSKNTTPGPESAAAPEAASPESENGQTPPPAAPEAASPEGASPEAASPEAATNDDSGAEVATFVDVVAAVGDKQPIRTRGGGRVRAVEARNGETLSRGQTILRLDDVALAREIATVSESVSALAAIAETSEGAKAALAEEREKLTALQAQARQQRVTAPTAGALAGLTVRAGDRVRPRQVIGFIQEGADGVNASVSTGLASKWTAGAAVELRMKDGSVRAGTVGGASTRSGGKALVPLNVGSANANDVTGARLKAP